MPENALHVNVESTSYSTALVPSTNLISRDDLVQRLWGGPAARIQFVESHLSKNLAFQLRSLRDGKDWTQQEVAAKVGMPQNVISRLENPYYGKQTITTLKRMAATYDVALIVRFVPFSQLIDYVSGTQYTEEGLRPEAMDIPSFSQEFPSVADLDIGPVPLRFDNSENQRRGNPERAADLANERVPPGREGSPIHLRRVG